jgi:cyanoexosortase A
MRTFLAPVQQLQFPKFWLLVLTGCVIALNLNLIGQAGLTNLQVTTLLFIGAIIYRFRNQSNCLILKGGLIAKILGSSILALVLLSSPFLVKYDFLIRLLPFMSALSLAIIASGGKGLKQYWQELMLFIVLAVPLERLIDPINQFSGVTTLIAKFSTFLLWYVGFEVARQGDTIIMPLRSTWVGPNCSGVLTMMWMVQLAILFLVMFPTTRIQKILVPIMAVLIVLLVNGIRTAIMAVLAARDYQAFEYWHSDNAQIFSTIPILLFVIFCRYLVRKNQELMSKG